MRIDLVEKLVTVLVALTIVLVAACVTFFTVVIQKSSGVEDNIAFSIFDTTRWLDEQRRRAHGDQGGPQIPMVPMAPTPAPAASTAPPAAGTAAAAQVAKRDNYIEDDESKIPPAEQVPGVPWLRRQPGVIYYRPEAVPQIVAQKYQAFDEVWHVAQEGGGEFVQAQNGATAYKVNWIQEQSMLRRMIGLRDGDLVLSVNGHPIGSSFAAGKQLYDQLKNEKRFAVKVLRNNQELVLSYFVK